MELKSEFKRLSFDPYIEKVNTLSNILNKELFFCEFEKYSKIDYYQFETSLISDEIVLGGISGLVEGEILRIDHMFLSKHLRGKSLGMKLLNQLEEDAKKYKVKHIYVESLDFHNVEFYTKKGFNIFGDIVINEDKNIRRVFLKKSL